ncbi:hypothetical protein MWU78_18665 [Arenibacter sp. F26102]|uniref:hypothetical protein n=1 Tax=Arenibacter sp. F26102 TaxID=2926416 RepID=UPI001FF22C82|nr:hypothetical protein [Arenibacter sp. F26102]MCK0147685.1 hypothetical protein [Arenibacter sp. F26102]
MKTYLITCMFVACLVMGCSEEGVGDKDVESLNLTADYTVLLKKDGVLQSAYLNADSEGMTVNSSKSDFEVAPLPELSYRNASKIGFYNSLEDCSATIKIHDFGDNTDVNTTVFTEDMNCEFLVKSMAYSKDKAFVAYVDPSNTKKDGYYLRILDLSISPNSYTEVELAKEPKQIMVSGNQVFVLARDSDITDKYAMIVINIDNGTIAHEANLGAEVLKISKDGMGNILVSYPNLHSLFDGKTMILGITTNYLLGKEPKFGYANSEFFGEQTLYYPMESGSKSAYPHIAAVYDFKENISILYIYENFLTQEERDLKYEIEDTTMVSYDSKNNLILIGYKKKGDSNKGGLMRIKPIPDPKFLDNVDLDGIPMELFPN